MKLTTKLVLKILGDEPVNSNGYALRYLLPPQTQCGA